MRGKGGLIKHACINIIRITLDSEVEIVSDRMQELVSDRGGGFNLSRPGAYTRKKNIRSKHDHKMT